MALYSGGRIGWPLLNVPEPKADSKRNQHQQDKAQEHRNRKLIR
jgi:hypothetical protein